MHNIITNLSQVVPSETMHLHFALTQFVQACPYGAEVLLCLGLFIASFVRCGKAEGFEDATFKSQAFNCDHGLLNARQNGVEYVLHV
jgi:hypothetical protein